MVGIIKAEVPAAAPVPVKSIRRPERPDKKQLDEALKAEQSAADALGKRIHDIKVTLDQYRNWRVIGSPETAVARAKADQVNVQFHDEVEKKRALKSELERLSEHMRAEARASKKPWSLEKVEALMAKLQDRLEHSSELISAKEQVSMVQQIEELSKWRKFLKECTTNISRLKSAIAEKDEVLDNLSMERANQRQLLDAIKKKEAANAPDVAALREEKNLAYEKIQVHRENMKKLRDEYHAKVAQFLEADQEYRKRQRALAEKRHAEFVEREKRRQERQERRNQMAKDEEVDEYYDKISACEKVLAELQRFTVFADPSTEGVEKAEEEKQARQAKLESVQGFGCLLKSKKDRDDDDWFSKPKVVKKPSSNGNKSAKSGSTKLVLQHHVILSFSEVDLPPPRTFGEVPDCLAKVKAKKDEFVKLQAEAKLAQAEKVVDGQVAQAEAEDVNEATSDDASESSAEAVIINGAASDDESSAEAVIVDDESSAEAVIINGAASDDASETSTGEAEAAVNEATFDYASESSTVEEEQNNLAAAGESVDAVAEETQTEEIAGAVPEIAGGNETEGNVGGVAEDTENGGVAEETKTHDGAAVENEIGGVAEETKTHEGETEIAAVAEETKTHDGAALETEIGGTAEETKTVDGAAAVAIEAASDAQQC